MFARLSLVRAFSLAATVVVAAAPARAQESVAVPAPAAPAEVTRQTYPGSLVERPLLLPRWLVQPTVDVGITNTTQGTGEAFGFGVDVGVARKLQVGAMVEVPVGPIADFGVVAVNLQTALGRSANLRFDVGAQRASLHLPEASLKSDGFVAGVGVPIKAKLNRWLAFVSGSTAARGFGGSPVLSAGENDRKAMVYGFSPPMSNDLLSLAVFPGSHDRDTLTTRNAVMGSLFLPVGVLVSPHQRFSFAVRTGYRMVFTHTDGSGDSGPIASASKDTLVHYVPLAFDVVVNPIRQLDVGFTALLNGYVGDNIDHGTQATPGWADQRQFNIWIAGRI